MTNLCFFSACFVDQNSTPKKAKKSNKSKLKRSKYSYEFGKSIDPQPTEILCENAPDIGDGPAVPRNMGWRWDTVDFGASTAPKSWFPGQINPTVRCLMKNMLNPFPLDTLNLTRRDSKGRIIESAAVPSSVVEKKPTLTIKKSNGEYLITMHPLKDNSKLETDFDPYLKCSPLKFSIRTDGEQSKRLKAKKILATRGFKRCSCPNLELCHCIDSRRKKLLLTAIDEVATQLNMKKPLDYDDMTASSDSELDVEFVAPAAESKIGKRVANVIHSGTQYRIRDFVQEFEEKLCVEKKNVTKQTKSCAHSERISKKVWLD